MLHELVSSGQIGLQIDVDSKTDVVQNNNNDNDPENATNDVQTAPIAMVVQTSVETLGA